MGNAVGVGAKDNPLLSSSNSAELKVKLLRLWTVRTGSGDVIGLGIKNGPAWYSGVGAALFRFDRRLLEDVLGVHVLRYFSVVLWLITGIGV